MQRTAVARPTTLATRMGKRKRERKVGERLWGGKCKELGMRRGPGAVTRFMALEVGDGSDRGRGWRVWFWCDKSVMLATSKYSQGGNSRSVSSGAWA